MKEDKSQKLILVTGATGYLAANLIKLLLTKNYKVRGTVRSLAKKEKYESLYDLVPSKKDNLTFVEADLLDEKSWEEAVKGVDWIAHLASPYLLGTPKDPQKELILPAVNGVKNVFKAALKFGVKRIVMTSSVFAITNGKDRREKDRFDEKDWSIGAERFYDLSKTLAEQEAWKIYEENKDKLSLTCINPGFIVGKRLLNKNCGSYDGIKEFFNIPLMPRLKFGVVDVKDVAMAHLLAFEKPKISNGKRYILIEDTKKVSEFIEVFRKNFGRYGYSFAKYHVPKFMFWLMTLFDKENHKFLQFWDHDYVLDNSLSKEELGVNYQGWEKAIVDMVNDMIENGMLKNKIK